MTSAIKNLYRSTFNCKTELLVLMRWDENGFKQLLSWPIARNLV